MNLPARLVLLFTPFLFFVPSTIEAALVYDFVYDPSLNFQHTGILEPGTWATLELSELPADHTDVIQFAFTAAADEYFGLGIEPWPGVFETSQLAYGGDGQFADDGRGGLGSGDTVEYTVMRSDGDPNGNAVPALAIYASTGYWPDSIAYSTEPFTYYPTDGIVYGYWMLRDDAQLPEPTSFVAWSALAVCGAGLTSRRKRRRG